MTKTIQEAPRTTAVLAEVDVLVAGGGKVGYYLTKALLEEGHELHLIEKDPVAAQKIAAELDIPVVCASGPVVDFQHTKNERVLFRSMAQRAKIHAVTILGLSQQK